MRKAGLVLLFLLMGYGIDLAFRAPNAEIFENGDLARIIFFHLPCAWGSSLFMILAPIFGAAYLITKKRVWDIRAAAAVE
ncbi:MAG TPA: hypothetical protein VMI31_12100, partial [Fimbriimonadaceae bacterium]|nr:hypothetical protein [Fimbriimonadaceae bacterium]